KTACYGIKIDHTERETTGVVGKAERLTWHKAWTMVSTGFSISYTSSLSFRYLDHKTGETATETLTQRELVARLKQHIPEKFFKMVRYFGFLANRVCGEKLPQVYRALGMDKPEPVAKVCYAQMVKQFLSRDPFECVLCGCRMVYRRAIAGLNVSGLKKNARDISLLRYMPA
ncbi:TPA: transposase, partial [Escherichia coli]